MGSYLFFIGFLDRPQSVHRAHVGEGEKFLRDTFSQARELASNGKPSVIFIDEIDAICPRRGSGLFSISDCNQFLNGSSYDFERVDFHFL